MDEYCIIYQDKVARIKNLEKLLMKFFQRNNLIQIQLMFFMCFVKTGTAVQLCACRLVSLLSNVTYDKRWRKLLIVIRICVNDSKGNIIFF